ncbi:MAG: hypothetical protein AAGB51_07960 [Planctomycetota bacterium]
MLSKIAASAFGAFALGLAVGLLTGLSQSPVVGVLLPLLFGTIGGTGGLFLAKANLAVNTGGSNVGTTGLAAGMLAIGTIVGVFWGMGHRTENRAVAQLSDAGFPPESATPEDVARWVMIERRLAAIGLDTGDRAAVLGRLVGAMDQPAPELDIDPASLSAVFSRAMPSEATAAEFGIIGTELDEWVEASAGVELLLELGAGESPGRFRGALIEQARLLSTQAPLLSDRDVDTAYLSANPRAKAALDLFRKLLEPFNAAQDQNPLERVSALLASGGGSNSPTMIVPIGGPDRGIASLDFGIGSTTDSTN